MSTSLLSGGSTYGGNVARILHEICFAANASFALVYGILLYAFSYKLVDGWPYPASSFKYSFLRTAVRINSLLSIRSNNSVGQQLTLGLSLLGVSLFLVILLRLSRIWPGLYRLLLNPVAGFTSLFTVPTTLAVVAIANVFPFPTGIKQVGNYWERLMWTVLLAEVACYCILLVWSKRTRLSWVSIGILSVLHCALWLPAIWDSINGRFIRLDTLYVTSLVFPFSAVAWVNYVRSIQLTTASSDCLTHSKVRGRTLGYGVLGVMILLLLWAPGPNYNLASSVWPEAAMIRMERGGTFCRCAVYTITIRSGTVTYRGESNVAVVGEKWENISQPDFLRLLREFDRVHFFSLEDRAFEECSDGPEVTVFVSLGRDKKTVTSEGFCPGAIGGPQYKFLTLAKRIDEIVNSQQWVGTESERNRGR